MKKTTKKQTQDLSLEGPSLAIELLEEGKKPGRGGRRPNQTGRPKGEPTDRVTFRASKRLLDAARGKYGKDLNKVFVAWLEAQVDEKQKPQ